ncbi:MAG: endonuclease Q family protein [bacterium]|nr:endonuclease Q family protein [bacterium]
MTFFADLHIHSAYSRATSKDMHIDTIARYAKLKGIKLIGTGDFTHPLWLDELKKELSPTNNNLFTLNDTYFLLTTEVSNVYPKNGKFKKIHNIIFAPSFTAVQKINSFLSKYGNLEEDGRPTLSLPPAVMTKNIIDLVPDALIVPAHMWTPWFSIFGSHSGFDSVEECFEDTTQNIFALETGLSSDPPMNCNLSALDRFALISNSDAHSPANIGRESNCFDCELSYSEIINVIKSKDKNKFKFTIEFFPEEGKYHWDGHRNCKIRMSPEEAIKNNNICPNCKRKITIGVLHRITALSDRVAPPTDNRIPCKHLIPLAEIIADVLGIGKNTKGVSSAYDKLVNHFETEYNCLLEVSESELVKVTTPQIAHSICNVRIGKVNILPGYDGEYGTIKVVSDLPNPTSPLLW